MSCSKKKAPNRRASIGATKSLIGPRPVNDLKKITRMERQDAKTPRKRQVKIESISWRFLGVLAPWRLIGPEV
jgi:hypothetical protein